MNAMRIAPISIAFLMLSLMFYPPVLADTLVGPYTTTADFASGNKSFGDAHFASNGMDQPMYSHITNPSAVYANGKTYVVWQSSPDWLPYITTYEHATNTWAIPVKVSNSIPIGQDGHGAPSVFITSNGYVHVMYGSHATSQEYSRSASPYDISLWTTMPDSAPVATYPNLWEYNGKLHFMYRRTGLDDWTVKVSSDNGVTWGIENVILSFSGGAGNGAYFGGAYSQFQDRIYFSFAHVTAIGVRTDAYVFYVDLDTMIAFSVSGTNLGTTVSESEANTFLRVRDGPFNAGFSVVHVDSVGNPYLMYSEQKASGSNPESNVNWTRWTGSVWTADQSVTSTDTGSNYFDFLINGPLDVEAFVTGSGQDWAVNVDEYSGDMERWTWNGAWTFREYIMREGESGKPVNHPEVPLNYRSDLRLVFDEFGALAAAPYEYVGGIQNLKLYGWGGTEGLVHRHDISSGNPGVESITDNVRFAPVDAVQLGRFPDDAFGTNDSDADTWKWNYKTWDGGGPSPVCTVNQREIVGGLLSVNLSSIPSGCEHGLVSTFRYSGDFDIWSIVELVYHVGTGSDWASLLAFNNPLPRCEMIGASLTDGVYYRAVGITNGFFETMTCTNGVLSTIGGLSFVVDSIMCMRIKKVGWNYTTYYAGDETDCAPWTQDEDFDFNVTGDLFPAITVQVTTGTVITAHWRFYDVFMDATTGIFRPFGRWETPTSIFANTRVSSITMGHSNLNATRYISRVDVIEDGIITWSYTTPITAGTITTLRPDENIDDIVSIRVTLAGPGSSSPVLLDVSYILSAPLLPVIPLPWLALILIVFLFAAGIVHPIFWFLDAMVCFYATSAFTTEYPNTLWAFVFLSFGIMLLIVATFRFAAMGLGGNRR